MARIKLSMPDKYLFETSISVRITDLNYGLHVGNDTILSLVHEARIKFLAHYGFDEGNLFGCGLIMADAALVYKAELFYGADLWVKVTPMDYSRKGFDLYYLLYDKSTNKVYAEVKTAIVCFDYTTRRPLDLPPQIHETWKL